MTKEWKDPFLFRVVWASSPTTDLVLFRRLLKSTLLTIVDTIAFGDELAQVVLDFIECVYGRTMRSPKCHLQCCTSSMERGVSAIGEKEIGREREKKETI